MALSQGIYRLLPWTSSIGGNKVMAEMLLAPNQHQSPVLAPTTTPMLPPTLKRKRDDDDDDDNGDSLLAALNEVPQTKRRLNNLDAAPPATTVDGNSNLDTMPEHKPDDNPSTSSRTDSDKTTPSSTGPGVDNQDPSRQDKTTPKPTKMDIDALRQSMDAQLSLEVLLKHDELRLIDQEIAKCQVALEQLRRCAEIPYPSSAVSGLSQSVSSGVGHAIPYSGTGPPPVSPAPWGVVDGPYSRHYAKWLLPDPRFDGGEIPPTPVSNYGHTEGRATRGNAIDYGHVAGKSTRAQRGSVSTRLQSLPSGYPAPRDRAGPMIMKRKSDNQTVKLVCLDCRRYDFSSTQGFINHCRIAHSRTFASHEAAADACGEPVDVDEAGAVVGGPSEQPPTSTAAPGYVHPLIRSAPAIDRTPKDNKARLSTTPHNPPGSHNNNNATTGSRVESPSKKRATPASRGPSSSSFVASPAAPHLSSFLADMGSGLNLSEIVGDAKTTVDMSTYLSESDSDDEGDGVTPVTENRPPLPSQGARLPARTTMPQAAAQRPTSSKGQETTRSLNISRNVATPSKTDTYVSPYSPSSSTTPGPLQLDGAHALDPRNLGEDLSPHTVESNQAPSLVSDDEDDYGAVSDSESLNLSSSEAGREDEEIDDIEVEDDEGTATPTGTDPKADVMTSLKRGHGKKGDRILAPTIVSLNRGKEGRRVDLVKGPPSSPSKPKKDSNSKQG